MKGRGLARVTGKAFVLAVITRLGAWWAADGSIDHLWHVFPWLMIATGFVLWMCLANLAVFVTWNLVNCLRTADETIKRIVDDVTREPITTWDKRPGGIHITTTGPHLRYIAPAAGGFTPHVYLHSPEPSFEHYHLAGRSREGAAPGEALTTCHDPRCLGDWGRGL